MSIELLLLNDVETLGKAGDLVRVAPGYARNYHIPQGIAEPVTEAARRRLAKLQAEREKVRKELLAAANKLADALKEAKVTVSARVSEGDALYGSVDAGQIAKALQMLGFPEVEPSMIQLEEPIKTLGSFDVPVRLHAEVAPTVKVWVVEEK